MVTATTSTKVGSFLLPYDPNYIYRVVAHYWEFGGGSSRDRGLSHLRFSDTKREGSLSCYVLWVCSLGALVPYGSSRWPIANDG